MKCPTVQRSIIWVTKSGAQISVIFELNNWASKVGAQICVICDSDNWATFGHPNWVPKYMSYWTNIIGQHLGTQIDRS